MTNQQAAHLKAGHRIRRKGAGEDAVYVVERIERVVSQHSVDFRIYAGGEAFWAWDVARCGKSG